MFQINTGIRERGELCDFTRFLPKCPHMSGQDCSCNEQLCRKGNVLPLLENRLSQKLKKWAF